MCTNEILTFGFAPKADKGQYSQISSIAIGTARQHGGVEGEGRRFPESFKVKWHQPHEDSCTLHLCNPPLGNSQGTRKPTVTL